MKVDIDVMVPEIVKQIKPLKPDRNRNSAQWKRSLGTKPAVREWLRKAWYRLCTFMYIDFYS
jgi:hypothetical protein